MSSNLAGKSALANGPPWSIAWISGRPLHNLADEPTLADGLPQSIEHGSLEDHYTE